MSERLQVAFVGQVEVHPRQPVTGFKRFPRFHGKADLVPPVPFVERPAPDGVMVEPLGEVGAIFRRFPYLPGGADEHVVARLLPPSREVGPDGVQLGFVQRSGLVANIGEDKVENSAGVVLVIDPVEHRYQLGGRQRRHLYE
jgi:hypothetical protein